MCHLYRVGADMLINDCNIFVSAPECRDFVLALVRRHRRRRRRRRPH